MVGRLLHFDERVTMTEFVVNADNFFVECGRFTAEGLLENIAQTCAARIGYVNKYILQKNIQIGVIGAIRKAEVESLPHAGDTIVTRVEVMEEIFGMTLAQAEVTQNNQTLMRAEMKIAVREEEKEASC